MARSSRQMTNQLLGPRDRAGVSGVLLARNTLLNLVGQAVPLLAGVLCIPVIIRGLGTERFGLLSLAWVVLGYFSIFDLGLARATTKYVAEAVGTGREHDVPRLVWTALVAQAMLGIAGGLLLATLTPLLVGRVFDIQLNLVAEAKWTLYVLSLSVPVVLVSGSLRGALEAVQRFDLVNAVRVPTSVSTFILPLVGTLLGLRLPAIVALVLAARVLGLGAYLLVNLRTNPRLRDCAVSLAEIPRLLAFGGWVTVTSVVSPILVYIDKIFIASILSMSAVGYYTAPYETITRLGIVAASLSMTLFPAFSVMGGTCDRQRLVMLFSRSVKYILVILGPMILLIGLFAREIVGAWLGLDFVAESAPVLSLLAAGVLVNSLAQIPFALLQGIGRPDIPAKIHLMELLPYVGMAWFFVSRWGIAGAAAAWTVRAALDALLLLGVACRIQGAPLLALAREGVTRPGIALVGLSGAAYGARAITGNFKPGIQLVFVVGLVGLYAYVAWRLVLDTSDRKAILGVIMHPRREQTADEESEG